MDTGGMLGTFAVLVLAILGIGLTLGVILEIRKKKGLRATAAGDPRAAALAPATVCPAVEDRPPESDGSGSGHIFVAYRRADSRHITGRIYDRLAQHYGPKRVLRDVDSFPLGVDFREYAARSIASCSVALVIIGPRFLERGADGSRRVDREGDHLRVELRSILDAGIAIVPVLVDGAAVPGRDELPEDISAIAYRTGVDVREDPFFHDDVQRLIAGMDRIVS